MSTILDALKKSERERTVLRGLGFSDAGWRPARDIDWLRWAVVAGIVAVVIIVAAVFVLRAGIVSFRSTAAQAPNASPPVIASPSVPAQPLPGDDATPLTTSPALEEVASLPLPETSALATPAKIEFLNAMPPLFRQAVPAMTVNIHVYAVAESSRILYINNRLYNRGDEIPGGVRVEEIIPEGVVLKFQGQRFKLARPS